MKKIIFSVILLLTVVPAQAQESKVMQVHSGGSVVYEIPTAQVDSVTFESVSLIGTKWKLAGIVDTETGIITELEPKDDRCYLLLFNEDNTYTGVSSTNDLTGQYTASFGTSIFEITIGGTERGEVYDGYLYVDILSSVQSFSLPTNNELRLYYNEKKNYLLYKSVEP